MPHIFSFLKSFSSPLRSKKAMEMSLNTVIVAVIALLVLGLMIFVLARNGNVFNKGTQCATYGGRCIVNSGDSATECKAKSEITHEDASVKLCNPSEICCSIVPGQAKEIPKTT